MSEIHWNTVLSGNPKSQNPTAELRAQNDWYTPLDRSRRRLKPNWCAVPCAMSGSAIPESLLCARSTRASQERKRRQNGTAPKRQRIRVRIAMVVNDSNDNDNDDDAVSVWVGAGTLVVGNQSVMRACVAWGDALPANWWEWDGTVVEWCGRHDWTMGGRVYATIYTIHTREIPCGKRVRAMGFHGTGTVAFESTGKICCVYMLFMLKTLR